MIYITGDTHRDFDRIFEFTKKYKTTQKDYLLILGDVGINYYLNESDKVLKEELKKLPITLLCIQGNHEERPENIKSYHLINMFNGKVFIENDYPNLIFLKDGEIYNINNKKVLVIGGAYSIDKQFRIINGYHWFKDEQPSKETKDKILSLIENEKIDIILSHTSPLKYEPIETFYSGINQNTVDTTTEKFLDIVEKKTNYQKWYCGHFHINKKIDKIEFLMEDIKEFNER